MKNITALILAAGEGKRIKPIVTSKPLIPFAGKTLLAHVIDSLKPLNINQLVIVVNPQDKTHVSKLFPQAKIVVQGKPTGMAEAVLAASKFLSGPTLIINGDDLVDQSITASLRAAIKADADQTILTGIKPDKYLYGAYFKLKRHQVTGIVEKPAADKLPSDFFKLVLDYFPRGETFVAALSQAQSKQDDLYELGLANYVQKNFTSLFEASGRFVQFKFPLQILDLTSTILSGLKGKKIAKTAQIHPTTVIDGPVQVAAGAQIMPYSVIKGPSFIGKNVIIGDHVLVRQSTIEAGSVVGFGSEIARSYVGPNNNFHANFVGDSGIEAEANLGSGAVLANLRFDKKPVNFKRDAEKIPTARIKFGAVVAKGAQIGVNASVMPGVSLESGEVVFSGAVKA